MKKRLALLMLVVSVALIGAACRPPTFPGHPTSLPPAPGNVVLTPGDRSITATFTSGFGSGLRAPLTDYRLTCNAPAVLDVPPLGPGWTQNIRSWDGEAVHVDGRTSPLVLSLADEMVNGTTFSCTVQAVNRHGVGQPSPPQDVTPVGPPRVASTLPIETAPGSALVFVNVYLESDDHASFSCAVEAPGIVEQSPQTCTFEVSGLEPATEYTATVTPSTSHGAGEPSTVTFSSGG